jgi:hypothetical protein
MNAELRLLGFSQKGEKAESYGHDHPAPDHPGIVSNAYSVPNQQLSKKLTDT